MTGARERPELRLKRIFEGVAVLISERGLGGSDADLDIRLQR